MNIKNVQHLQNLKTLPYPRSKMLIIGSGTLALLGLRKNKDIDIWVTEDLFQKVSQNNLFNKTVGKISGDVSYTTKDGKIEIFDRLSPLKDKVEEHLKRSIVVQGFYFQSPEDVLNWKKAANRTKDIHDIKLLQNYLRQKVVERYLNVVQTL